jgi:hypothetical protein
MTRRLTATLMTAILFLASLAPVHAAPVKKQCNDGLTIPITATSADQGSFVGALEIQRFAVVDHGVVAIATLTGTLTDEAGVMTGIVRNVSLPLQLPSSGAAKAGRTAAAQDVVTQAVCDILHLVLGPLDLNLLGLIVHLDVVVLDITADPAGGLLGSLLCAIAGLLGQSPLEPLLEQLVDLLNQILAILG